MSLEPDTDNRACKVSISRVSKRFQTDVHVTNALGDLSLDIETGAFVCIVGPSGCGKTTLLRMIAGLDKPTDGTISIDGSKVTGPGPDRMVLFQESALFPWLTAIQNIEFGLRLQKILPAPAITARARELLSMVGLEDFANRYIHELSGGMKQRVALARALAPNPQVLLMDEPFAALDAMTREQLYFDLQKIWAVHNKTIILVTHNVREAVCLGTRVLIMSPRPGQIRADRSIDLPRPRDINDTHVATLAGELKELLKSSAMERPL